MPRHPEVMCPVGMAHQSTSFKAVSVLISSCCHTGGLTSGSFSQNEPTQPALLWTLAPEATNSCFRTSHALSDFPFFGFSFMLANID